MGKEIIYYEEDHIGKHQVIDNGKTKTRILVQPSKEYQKKMDLLSKRINREAKKKEKERDLERRIKEKMREIALRELEE